MKTLKSTLIAIAGTLLLLMMVLVNVQVGLNDGANSDISLLGTDISLVESTFAQDTPPGEEGDLRCNDLSVCVTNRGCGTAGYPDGCELHCDDGDYPPLQCPWDPDVN